MRISDWSSDVCSSDLIYRDRSPISKSQDLVPLYRPTATDTDIDTIRVYERSTGKDRVLVGPQMSAGWRNNGGNPKYIGFSAKRRYAISADSKYLFVAYGGQIHKDRKRTRLNSSH